MNIANVTVRLLATIQVPVPTVTGVSIGTIGNSATVKVIPTNEQAAAQATIDAFDWTQPAQDTFENQRARTIASGNIDTSKLPEDKKLRGALIVAVDEINILREWLTSFKTEVAAATSLADLKTRVATLPDVPDRTTQQAYTAIKNKITSGAVD